MKTILRQCLTFITTPYRNVENYLTSGFLGAILLSIFTHPIMRYSFRLLLRFIAVYSAFIGLYYFFAELMAVLFSTGSLTYLQHSTLELLLPLGTIIDDRTSQLSPLSTLMQAAFLLQSCGFVFIYLLGVTQFTGKRFRLIGGVSAFCFSIGMGLIVSSQGGKYLENGLQNIGASITFICGNLTLLATGLGILPETFRKLKGYCIVAGLIGTGVILTTLFVPTPYFAVLERLGIYTILMWEIAISFAILKQVEK